MFHESALGRPRIWPSFRVSSDASPCVVVFPIYMNRLSGYDVIA